jgi:methylthioribose-1-phosphate isomerase
MRKSIFLKQKTLYYLDQRQLPGHVVYKKCSSLKKGYQAIKSLQVRGAPLIGVFAAYCAYIAIDKIKVKDKSLFLKKTREVLDTLGQARPTAVNLFWALGRIHRTIENNESRSIEEIKKTVFVTVKTIHKEDIALSKKIGRIGSKLVKKNSTILTHCNTGFLATSGEGTALAVIYQAHRRGRKNKIYVDETRPLLQGARLTAWELIDSGLDATLICDNTASFLMQQGRIDLVILGADRIAANGDVANKIGTYNLAVSARYHKIPFYVAAPANTFDLSLKKGEQIPIEQRDSQEVKKIRGKCQVAPDKVKVYNPAFDITPHELVSAIITDKGIIYPPFKSNIKRLIK